MLQTLEATIDEQGNVQLIEPINLTSTRRALVIILDEPAAAIAETASLSEQTLTGDWQRQEEEAAWAYLQQQTE